MAQWQRIYLPTQETWVRSLRWEDLLEENGYPLQDSCQGNPMDGGVWRSYSPWESQTVGGDRGDSATQKNTLRLTERTSALWARTVQASSSQVKAEIIPTLNKQPFGGGWQLIFKERLPQGMECLVPLPASEAPTPPVGGAFTFTHNSSAQAGAGGFPLTWRPVCHISRSDIKTITPRNYIVLERAPRLTQLQQNNEPSSDAKNNSEDEKSGEKPNRL